MIFWVVSYKYSLFKLQGTSCLDQCCSNLRYVCVCELRDVTVRWAARLRHCLQVAGLKCQRRDRLVLTL